MIEKIVIILLIAFAGIKAVFFSGYGFGLLDEGESLHNAQRILSGEIPYRDFFAIFPPMDNYIFALVFKLFGESVLTPRVVMSLLFAFVPLLLFLIAKIIMPIRYALIPAVLLIFLDLNIERLYIFSFLLMGLYLFLLSLEKPRFKTIFLSGFFIGVSCLFRVDISGAFVVAMVIGSFISIIMVKKEGLKKLINILFPLLLGGIIPIGMVLCWMVREGVLFSFLNYAFIRSIIITELHDLPFPSPLNIFPKDLTLSALSHSYEAAYGTSIIITYVVMIMFLIKKWHYFWTKVPSVGILLLAGIFTLPYVFGRSDMGHMIKGGIPFLILGTYIFYKITQTKYLAIKGLFLIIIFGFFVVNIIQSIWWINLNNQIIIINDNQLKVSSKYLKGTTIVSGDTLKNATDFLKNHSSQNEPVLVLPYMAGLYFLSDRKSPTEFNNVLAGFIIGDEEQREFIEKIDKSNVSVVVYDPQNGPKMKTSLLKGYNPLIDQYILNNFTIMKTTKEGWLLMKRKI